MNEEVALVQIAASNSHRASQEEELRVQQMAALLGDLLQILSHNCNLPGSAAIIQDLSLADPSRLDVHQVRPCQRICFPCLRVCVCVGGGLFG